MLLRDRSTRRHLRPQERRTGSREAGIPVRPSGEVANDTTYVVVHEVTSGSSAGTTAGWTLLGLHRDGSRSSLPLAAHGAAPTAPARVAKAVALRVLHERGVDVTGWRGAGGDRTPMYRAALLGSALHAS